MNRLLPESEKLRSDLAAMLGEVRAIVPMESGTTGKSYRIDTDQSQYVVKHFRADSDALLGPRAQFELLSQLADKNIAPRPAGYDEASGLLVTDYLGGVAAVPSDKLQGIDRLSEIVSILRDLHAATADIKEFAPAEYADRYIARLGGYGQLSRQDKQRSDEFYDLASSLDDETKCLCHNDLVSENILWGPSPKLIDFDYAVLATPVLDLASLAVCNHFSEQCQSRLLADYLDGSEISCSLVEFARVQRLVRLLAHFWSLASAEAEAGIVAQYGISDD